MQHGRRASTLGVGGRATVDGLARWWGCCAVNRLADQAGPYRRMAAGLAVLPLPLAALAGALAADDRWSTGYAVAHSVVAIGCGWLASDLIEAGSTLAPSGRPHTSAVALLCGIGLLVVLAPVDPVVGFGPPIFLVSGLGALVGGFVLLMAAERQRDRILSVVGRWVVSAGAVLVGAMGLGRASSVDAGAPLQAAGIGTLSIVLLVMGWSEARVLLRGAALYRTLVRR